MGGSKSYDPPETPPPPKYAQDAPTMARAAQDSMTKRRKNSLGLMGAVKTSGVGESTKADTGKKLLSGTS